MRFRRVPHICKLSSLALNMNRLSKIDGFYGARKLAEDLYALLGYSEKQRGQETMQPTHSIALSIAVLSACC